jgi:hypothetical protein
LKTLPYNIIPHRSGAALKLKNPTWRDVERNRLIREKHLLGKDDWESGSVILPEKRRKARGFIHGDIRRHCEPNE